MVHVMINVADSHSIISKVKSQNIFKKKKIHVESAKKLDVTT